MADANAAALMHRLRSAWHGVRQHVKTAQRWCVWWGVETSWEEMTHSKPPRKGKVLCDRDFDMEVDIT
jgi:hypothetical protein